jgi:hypothetical protein
MTENAIADWERAHARRSGEVSPGLLLRAHTLPDTFACTVLQGRAAIRDAGRAHPAGRALRGFADSDRS